MGTFIVWIVGLYIVFILAQKFVIHCGEVAADKEQVDAIVARDMANMVAEFRDNPRYSYKPRVITPQITRNMPEPSFGSDDEFDDVPF